eukprot:361484-Chlamydomonas_euryale.AAC.2
MASASRDSTLQLWSLSSGAGGGLFGRALVTPMAALRAAAEDAAKGALAGSSFGEGVLREDECGGRGCGENNCVRRRTTRPGARSWGAACGEDFPKVQYWLEDAAFCLRDNGRFVEYRIG